MDLTVVVPTLNGRDRLAACLDALAAHAPDAEVVVVNGPSADGTTGMVRDRDDVDVLVEISNRTVNVARNAGIEVATGDAIALVDYDNRIGESWLNAVSEGLESADVVTGPVTTTEPRSSDGVDDDDTEPETDDDGDDTEPEADDDGDDTEPEADDDGDDTEPEADDDGGDGSEDGPERRTIAGRDVTYFNGGNVVFRRETLRDLDGFDEYLRTGGARDAAHRLAQMDHDVAWRDDLAVTKELQSQTAADGGRTAGEWGWKYRALAYRLLKNYGVRPTVIVRAGSHAVKDGVGAAGDVLRGKSTPSRWAATGRDVLVGLVGGSSDGLVARRRDRSPARNPNGISKRADRAVAKYDQRE